MKRVFLTAVTALFLCCASPGLLLAGNGRGLGDGTGPIHDVCAGVSFVLEGDIVGPVEGKGVLVATDGELVTIFGIGPNGYWASLGVEKPGVGETVTVEGYTVNYEGEFRNIAMSITTDGQTVQLRDPTTCSPLWQGRLQP